MPGPWAAAALLAVALAQLLVAAAGQDAACAPVERPPLCTETASAIDYRVRDVDTSDPAAILRGYFGSADDPAPYGQEYVVVFKREVQLRVQPSQETFVLGQFVPEESGPACHVYDFGERQVGRQRCARHSRVTVTYGCQRGAADEIVAVSEFGACEYWLQVATDRVCPGADEESHDEL